MRWTDILEQVKIKVGADISTNAKFTQSNVRLIGAAKQQEISAVSRCLEFYYDTTTVSAQQQYALPKDTFEILKVKCGTVPLTQNDGIIIDSGSALAPTAQPLYYFMLANYLTLYPMPSASGDTISIYGTRKSPMYAFQAWYMSGVATGTDTALTSVKMSVRAPADPTTGSCTINVLKTKTVSSSYDFNFGVYATVKSMISTLNATTGLTVVQATDCSDDMLCSQLELREGVEIKYSNAYLPSSSDTVGESKPRFYFEPEIPTQAHPIIIEGIVEEFKFADREMPASNATESLYRALLKRFADSYRSGQNNSGNFSRMKVSYGIRGGTLGGEYVGSGGFRVFIP